MLLLSDIGRDQCVLWAGRAGGSEGNRSGLRIRLLSGGEVFVRGNNQIEAATNAKKQLLGGFISTFPTELPP